MDSFGKKILLSAGIGLGMAVSGVSLYLLLKPEEEYPYVDRDQRKIKQSNQSVVTIRVPKQFVGAVIGRGGEHIKRIQTDTKTRINFDDTNTGINSKDNGVKEVRVLLIKGTPENTAKAEMAINEIIEEQSRISTKHFSVDTNAIGGIIGRNGDNIRSLCDRSGAKIKVDPNSKNRKAIMTSIWITGTDEQIEEAVLLINKEISQNQSFSRNRSQNESQNRLTNYKLFAIEEQSNDNTLNLDTYFAKLEPINQQLLEVFVSAVNSPDQFYVQIRSTGVLLDQLMEETTDFYEIEENRITFKPLSLKVGDIVVVPYPFDEHYYRAKVLAIEDKPYSLEDSDVKVFYLDYGDTALIKYNQICDLKDDLLKRLPFQAIECSLSGVVPKDLNNWSEEAILKFKELSHNALWKTIYAKLIDIKVLDGKREKYVIELSDKQTVKTNNSNDDDWDDTPVLKVINIGQELIDMSLALPQILTDQ